MVVIIIAAIGFGFLLTALLTGAMKRLAPAIGFVDKPGGRKVHHTPTPLGGGVAIFLGIALPILAGLAIVNTIHIPADGRILSSLAIHQPGIRQQTPLALKVLAVMTIIHLLGLCDDRRALGAFSKLIVQLLAVSVLVLWADLRALTLLDGLGLGRWPSVILTVLWITGITNAMNFLDNMDGLSAGVGAVCTAAMLVTTLLIGQWFVATCLALLLGALLGFLCYNFPPASIFMGDSGSLVVGFLLGVLTIRTTYVSGPIAQGWYAVFAPVVILALPLYDLLVVSAIRLSRGQSPFKGDTNHFSHRLVARGMSRRTAVLCIWLVTAATSVAAIALPHVHSTFAAVMIFAQTILILAVVMLLERHPLPADPDHAQEPTQPAGAR